MSSFLLTCCPGQSDCDSCCDVSRSRGSWMPGSAPHPPHKSQSLSWLRVWVQGCPHPAQTLDRASYCLQSRDMYSEYCHQTVSWNQSYRTLLPVFSPDAPAAAHYSELTTIHPRCVVPPWPGQAGRSLAPALSAASRLSQLSRKRTAARYRPVSPASVTQQ